MLFIEFLDVFFSEKLTLFEKINFLNIFFNLINKFPFITSYLLLIFWQFYEYFICKKYLCNFLLEAWISIIDC